MGIVRSAYRSLRQNTVGLRNRARMMRGTRAVQEMVPLLPEHRTGKRRRPHVIVDLVHRYCPGPDVVLVEIGTVGGATSVHIARYCPQISKIYAVDIVKPDDDADHTRGHDRIEFVHAASVDAAKRFADKSVDFVFIDADHSAKAVYEDLQAWVPKVRPGGVLAGHDYGSHRHYGVKPAVDFFFAQRSPKPVGTDADRVWWTINEG